MRFTKKAPPRGHPLQPQLLDGIKKMIGKRIKGIVLKTEAPQERCTQMIVVFSDDTAYEIWGGEGIYGAGGFDRDGMAGAERYFATRADEIFVAEERRHDFERRRTFFDQVQ